jgi:hypothetical protein
VPELRWTEPEWLTGAEAWIRERVDVTGELDQAARSGADTKA